MGYFVDCDHLQVNLLLLQQSMEMILTCDAGTKHVFRKCYRRSISFLFKLKTFVSV